MTEDILNMPTGVWVIAFVAFIAGIAIELFFAWLRSK